MPVIRSLTTSFVGAAPEGAVTFGSSESGPVVGVFAGGVGVVELVDFDALACASALSALFSFPTVIVLEPLEPHADRSAAAASPAMQAAPRLSRRGRPRVRRWSSKWLTGGQPSGSRLRSDVDRARRGGSGALHPQSALAGLNSPSRGSPPVAPLPGASRARAPRGAGSRTRSGPEGSSLKRSPAGAAGAPGPEPQAAIGVRGWCLEAGCTVRCPAAACPQPQRWKISHERLERTSRKPGGTLTARWGSCGSRM